MREPRRSDVPADGDCVSTRFAGCDERLYTTAGRSPSVLSRRSAGVCASEVTRGAETRRVAAVDVVAVVAVVAVVTVVVVDVVVVDGPDPVEAFSVTFEPLSTSVPAFGFCATTVPTGFADGTL